MLEEISLAVHTHEHNRITMYPQMSRDKMGLHKRPVTVIGNAGYDC